MLVENQLISVKVVPRTYQHYRDLGYDCKCCDIISVPPEHLTKGSNALVDVVCDFCNKIMKKKYYDYLTHHTDGYDYCSDCCSIKKKKTYMEKYGVDWIFKSSEIKDCIKNTNIQKYGSEYYTQTDEFKEKAKQTILGKYGCEYYSQTENFKIKFKSSSIEHFGTEHPAQSNTVKNKMKNTLLDRYGVEHPMYSEEIKEKLRNTVYDKYGVYYYCQTDEYQDKVRQTCLERYGVPYASQNEEIKNKIKATNLEKYGFENPLQNPEILAKVRASLCENGTGKASKPQKQLFEIIKKKYPSAELNYPYSTCSLDIYICVDGIKIDIEYDGTYWHQDKQRDIKRDKFLQANGFKTLRIKSERYLPDEATIFDAIDLLINTDRIYKEIIADKKEVSA